MTYDRRLTEAAENFSRHLQIRAQLEPAIREAMSCYPRSASYDEPGGSPTPWCWDHGREVTRCHADDLLCDGESLRHNDPTGDAAMIPDRARDDLDLLPYLEKRILSDMRLLADLDDRYLPRRLPTGAERAKLATAGEPGCGFCLRDAKTWSPPMTKEPTTVSGNLARPELVCRGHYDHIRKTGRAPTPAETQHYVRHGKWPKQKAA